MKNSRNQIIRYIFPYFMAVLLATHISGCGKSRTRPQQNPPPPRTEEPAEPEPDDTDDSSDPQKPSPQASPEKHEHDAYAKQSLLNMDKCLAEYQNQYPRIETKTASAENGSLPCFDTDQEKASINELITKVSGQLLDLDRIRKSISPSQTTKEEVDLFQEQMAELTGNYNALVEMFAVCRTSNFLKSGPSPQILNESGKTSGSLLLHTVGDVFALNNEDLEGNQSKNTLALRLDHLSKLKDVLNKHKYIDDQSLAHPCHNISNLPFTDKNGPFADVPQADLQVLVEKHQQAQTLLEKFSEGIPNLGEFRNELTKQLKSLTKEGDAVFLPGGWEGHAIVYQFVKGKGYDEYTFRAFNSGEGINAYHAHSVTGYEVKYMPFVEVTQISLEGITLRAFLKTLMEVFKSKADETKPENFYEQILPWLDGKPSKISYDAFSFKSPQQAGTCSYFSQPWVLAATFDQMRQGTTSPNGFLPMQLESLFGLKTLYDYWQLLKKSPSIDLYSKRALLKKSMVFLASDLASNANEGIIDSGLLQVAAQVEGGVKADVDKAITNMESTLAGEKINIPATIQDTKRELSADLPDVAADISALAGGNINKSIFMPNKDATIGSIKTAVVQQEFIQAIDSIRELASSFSLDPTKYPGMDDQGAQDEIADLREIQANYLYAILGAIKQGTRPPKTLYMVDFLVAMKLMAVADMLNRNFIIEKNRLPSLYQRELGALLYGDIAINEISSAKWQDELMAIRKFYALDNVTGENSLFGLETIPAGANGETRRIMYDKASKIPDDEKHWSDDKEWRDVEWVESWIKRQDEYPAWLQQEKANTDWILPFTYGFSNRLKTKDAIEADITSPGNHKFTTLHMKNRPDVSRVKDEIIIRRQALLLLGKAAPHQALPDSFFDLRSLSLGLDYLLSGNLSKNFPSNPEFNINMNKQNINHVKYVDTESFNIMKWYINNPYDVNETYKLTSQKLIENIYEFTVFSGQKFYHKIFSDARLGTEGYRSEDDELCKTGKPMPAGEKEIVFICRNVHLQNGAMPFRAYQKADESKMTARQKDAQKKQTFNILALMNIYGKGVVNTNEEERYDPLQDQERKRLLPNDLIIQDPYTLNLEGIKELTLERIRGVFTLSGIKSLQLDETLAIFSNYSSLLGREEYQRIFEKLMFEPDLLLDELKISEQESARFIKKLTDFSKVNFDRFKAYDNYKEMAFTLRMNQIFKSMVEYASKAGGDYRLPPNPLQNFLNSPKEIFDYLKAEGASLSDSQKGFFYLNMANMFKYTTGDLTKDDVFYLLLAKINYNIFAITDANWIDNFISTSTENILRNKIRQIFEVMKNMADRNEILDKITAHVDAAIKNRVGDWSPPLGTVVNDNRAPQFYQAQFDGGLINIDVIDGNFFKAGSLKVALPNIPADYLKVIFGDAKPAGQTVDVLDAAQKKYSFTYNGRQIRFKLNPFTLQENIGGKWYQYIHESDMNNLGTEIFKLGFENWLSENQDEVLVRDNSKKLLYEIKLKPAVAADKKPTIDSVKDVVANLFLKQVPADDYPVNVFKRIESPKFIEVWSDNNNYLEVRLPRFNRKFISMAANQFNCANHEGYALSENQYSKQLGSPVNYITCSKKGADGKIDYINLLPAQRPYAEKIVSLSAAFSTDRDINNVKDGSQRLLIYKESDGEPRDLVENAEIYHLALRRWWQHDYPEAQRLLGMGSAHLGPLSKYRREVDAIKWLVLGRQAGAYAPGQKNKVQDLDPRATAIRMLAASILLAQEQEFKSLNPFFQSSFSDAEKLKDLAEDLSKPPNDIKNFVLEISDIYQKYLTNLSTIGDRWVNFYDEWTVANFIQNVLSSSQLSAWVNISTDVMDNRMIVLKHLHPSRFEDKTKNPTASKFRPKAVSPQGINSPKLSKARHEINGYDDLAKLMDVPENLTLPAGGQVITKALPIFADESLFKFFYTIAVGEPLSFAYRTFARNFLKDLFDLNSSESSSLTEQDIRREFAFLFATSALYKDDEGELKENKMARFYDLVYQRANESKLSRYKTDSVIKDIADIKKLEAEIAAIQIEADNLYSLYSSASAQTSRDYYYGLWSKKLAEKWPKEAAANTLKGLYNTLLSDALKNVDIAKPCFRAEATADKDVKAKSTAQKRTGDATLNDAFRILDKKLLIKDPFASAYLVKARFDEIFNSESMSDAAKNEIDSDSSSLIAKLSIANTPKAPSNIKLGVNELIKSIKSYVDKIKNETVVYSINDLGKFNQLKNDLEEGFKQATAKMNGHRDLALALVNQRSVLDTNSNYIQIKRLAQIEDEPKIEDLLYLLVTNKLGELKRFTLEEQSRSNLDKIALNLVQYLLESTLSQYLKSCLDKLAEYSKAPLASRDQQLLLNQLATLLLEKRHYDFRKHIEYLVFEHFIGIHIRKLQVDALDKLKLKDGQIGDPDALGPVLEMIMGFGKTKVLLPIVSSLNTKGDWLNIIMLPESLIASMSRDLRQDIGRSFNRAVYVLEMSRQSKPTAQKLGQIYDDLVRARNEKSTVVTTNSAVQSLFLTFIDFMYNYNESPAQTEPKLTEIRKIFRFLREYGRLTIDEVDMALDVLKAHQFSVGKRKDIHKAISSTVYAFYRMIAITDLKNSVKLPFLRESSGPALTPTSYENGIKDQIIDKLASNDDFFSNDGSLKTVYNVFINDPENVELLKNYLKNKGANAHTLLFKKITDFYDKENEATDMKNISSVLYDEINQIFLLTATKTYMTHYGPLPEPIKSPDETQEEFNIKYQSWSETKFISIPYHAGSPALNARFGSPLEALSYSIQQGLENRSLRDHIELKINALKAQNLLSSSAATQKHIEENMKALFGVPNPPKITRVTSDDIDKVAQNLQTSSDTSRIKASLDLIKEFSLPQIKTYDNQLHTNAQIYGSLFRVVTGFSGTLWSINTFPDIFKKGSKSDTTAKTFMLLWQQYMRLKRANPGFKAVRSIDIEELKKAEPDKLKALVNNFYDDGKEVSTMDLGGMLRGIPNKSVSQAVYDKKGSMEGIVFYDDEERINILGPGRDETHPIETSPIRNKDKRLAYWDKKHTTGSDLKLKADMVGRITWDHHTYSRDVEQTVWRLRGLADGQSIDRYSILKEDLEIVLTKMYQILGVNFTADLFDLGEHLLFITINQDSRLGELLHRSLKYKMSNVASKEAIDQMFDQANSNYKAFQIYNSFSSMFLKNISADPYTYMGFPVSEANKDTVIQEDKDKLLKDITVALQGLGPQVLPSVKTAIDKVIADLKGLLPDILKTSKADGGLEVEVEQEQELEAETEREIEKFHFTENLKPHLIIKWNFDDQEWLKFTPIAIGKLGQKPVYEQITKSKSELTPIFRLKDALLNSNYNSSDYLTPLGEAIDKKILVSLNWAPIHHRNSHVSSDTTRYHFAFFDLYQKNISNLLVVVENDKGDDEKNQVQLVIIDNNDAAQFETLLRKYKNTSNTKVALLNLAHGMFRQTGDMRIDEEQLIKNQSFINQLVQIKFIGGYLTYTDDQLVALEKWIAKQDKFALGLIFRSRVIQYKQETREQMNHSDLGRLFEKLGIE